MAGDVRLISKRLHLKGGLAVFCGSVSFFVIILALCISAGFRETLRGNLASIAGDVRITATSMDFMSEVNPIETDAPYVDKIKALDYVESVNGFIYRAGILKTESSIHGVVFKGVSGLDSLTVSIPRSLADALMYDVGSEAVAYFVGEKVKVRKFTVGSIYNDFTTEENYAVVYAPIQDMRRLNKWADNEVSTIEVVFRRGHQDDISTAQGSVEIANLCYRESDPEKRVTVQSILQQYPSIFDWLRLIDFNVLLVVLIMIIVAAFNMSSSLLIILFEHVSMIGLLKALGMTNRRIVKVFLRSSSWVVLRGLVYGNLLALGVCWLQASTHLMTLDPENYFVAFVPIAFPWLKIAIVDVACYVTLMLILIIPTLFISRVEPSKTLKIN